MIDLRGPALDARVDRLNGIGRFQARAQRTKKTEAVERQSLLEALVQAGGRRGIEQDEFGADLLEGARRGLAGRVLIRRLQFATERRS